MPSPALPAPEEPHSPARTLRDLNVVVARGAAERGDSFAHHRPINVHLQVASGCNLECYMCIELLRPPEMRRGRGLQSLSREVFDKLCEQVFPYSSRLHIGFGGEPTLAPDFLHFIERGHACGQLIDLTTNGTRLGQPGMAETIARCVSTLRISIDAATAETYERIRVGSRWSHLRAGLDKLNAERLTSPLEERTELVLVFVLMKSNLHELPQFVELAAELGANGVRGQHVIPTTAPGAAEMLSDEPERYNQVREEAAARARSLGIDFDAPAPFDLPDAQPITPPRSAPAGSANQPASDPSPSNTPVRERRDCPLPTQDLYVTYEGKTTPCCNPHANAKMLVGDLTREDFDDIWNNAAYRGLRQSLCTGDVHPICEHCPIGRSSAPPESKESEWLLGTPTLQEWSAAREQLTPHREVEDVDMLQAMQSSGLLDHLAEVMEDRAALRQLATDLEQAHPRQLEHIANLEAERPHLLGHIANLEAELARRAPGSRSLVARGKRLMSRVFGKAHGGRAASDRAARDGASE